MNHSSSRPVILHVEDDPSDVMLIRRAFEKLGVNAELRHVTNGDEAVSYLAGEADFADRSAHPLPQLLLLDLKLPRRNGIEVTQWLRARPDALRRVPVIMLTSSNRPGDVDDAYNAGINSYLVKPDTAMKLTECVAAVQQYWLGVNEFPQMDPGAETLE